MANASAATVNRVVCHCDDCQAFAHHLGRTDLLDPHGGTDIVQVAPSTMRLSAGQDRVVGLRLTPKGLYRWHTDCCNTPVGNTVGPSIPFVGIVADAFNSSPGRADEIFGRPIGGIMGQYAVGGTPDGTRGVRLPILLRALFKVLGWRLAGRTWPHPFFDRPSRKPRYPVATLTSEQRDRLRPLCGPKPSARA